MSRADLLQAEDAEQAVLAALLQEPTRFGSVRAVVGREDFAGSDHRALWDGLAALIERGDAVDPLTLASELERQGTLERAGGKDYVGFLVDAVPGASNVRYHAGIVKQAARRRALVALAHGVADAVASGEQDPETAAQGMLGELVGLAVDGREGQGFRRVDAAEYVALLETIEQRADSLRRLERGEVGSGPAFGLKAVDRHVIDLRPGEFVTLGAGPKVGKTATVLCVATHNVVERAQHVGAVSAEMTRTEWLERCANHLARVRVDDTARGFLSDVERARLIREGNRLTGGAGGLHVYDVDFPDLGSVLAAIQALKVEQPKTSLVIVDYLQLVTKRMDGRRGDEEIAGVCAGLKAVAKRCEVAVIAPAQLNYKETDTRADGKPTLRDYQGASAPAQTANFPLLLWRPHLHSPMADPRELWILSPRSRRCAPFEAKVLWEGEYLKVSDWPLELERSA